MMCTLEIKGPCPTKKNNWKSWRGRVVIDPETKARLDQMQLQAQAAWRGKPALSHVHRYAATFYASNPGQDLDGMNTTLLDVLQKAGVLANDNISRVPSQITMAVVVPEGEERVVVTLEA